MNLGLCRILVDFIPVQNLCAFFGIFDPSAVKLEIHYLLHQNARVVIDKSEDGFGIQHAQNLFSVEMSPGIFDFEVLQEFSYH